MTRRAVLVQEQDVVAAPMRRLGDPAGQLAAVADGTVAAGDGVIAKGISRTANRTSSFPMNPPMPVQIGS